MRSLLLLLVLTIGCGVVSEPITDGSAVKATTSSSNASQLPQWEAKVQSDIQWWRDFLPAGCPMPFHYWDPSDPDDRDANTVQLVPYEEWDVSGIGHEYGVPFKKWNILIKSLPGGGLKPYYMDPTWIVLKHELGHALGLGHANPDYGSSLMLPFAAQPEERDRAAAACKLRCGPCNSPDKYNAGGGKPKVETSSADSWLIYIN